MFEFCVEFLPTVGARNYDKVINNFIMKKHLLYIVNAVANTVYADK
jgi:hypothetical protein